jgi:hypothetical protein
VRHKDASKERCCFPSIAFAIVSDYAFKALNAYRVYDSISLGIFNIKSSCHAFSHRSPLVRSAYFLPDFLMPWEPVFMGPLLLPTLPASSSRAFLSVVYAVSLHMPTCSMIMPLRGHGAGNNEGDGTNRQRAWPCARGHPHRAPAPSSWASCYGWGWYRLFARNVSMVPVLDPAICDCEAR